jgi:hypothetical protein
VKRTHPGRPPLDDDDPSEHICLSVPGKQFDELDARARRARVTIQEIIRRDLERQQPPKTYTK